jgi:hypothetical protein
MFVNLSAESRQQLLRLVQIMHMSEADVVAFALQHLFDEKNPDHAGGEDKAQAAKSRRRLIRDH